MKVKFCANRYRNIHGNWKTMYERVYNAFEKLGAEIQVSQYITSDYPSIVDEEDAIYVYNHTTLGEIRKENFYEGKQTLFLKPTAPTPDYFSIDTLGYACNSFLAYNKPNFENYESNFFEDKVPLFIENKENKWSDRDDLKMVSNNIQVPDNHILIIGQMPGDSTVLKYSFGSHWEKLIGIVHYLWGKAPIVVKIHPTLQRESEKDGTWEKYRKTIESWKSSGVTVINSFESIHNILPKTKVAIVENSTAGVECMMHDVPIISYGYPEYHWITKDLRHLPQLDSWINDLSWWSKEQSRRFLSWYCEEYLCYDQESTNRRIKWLIES